MTVYYDNIMKAADILAKQNKSRQIDEWIRIINEVNHVAHDDNRSLHYPITRHKDKYVLESNGKIIFVLVDYLN